MPGSPPSLQTVFRNGIPCYAIVLSSLPVPPRLDTVFFGGNKPSTPPSLETVTLGGIQPGSPFSPAESGYTSSSASITC
ncbi:hypothetical protein MRX96_018706 [Rhipicephalus microplus]